MNSTNPSRGVYFLANNKVFDLAVAFLNSFRIYNPDLPLCLIPYNENSDKIIGLKEIYKFQVCDNLEILHECDKISVNFHGHDQGAYRKLSMWEGPFDEFIYIDIDTVLLSDVSFVFQYLHKYDCFTSHSNMREIFHHVWKVSIFDSGLLNIDQISFVANTGFIVSKKGFMTLDGIRKSLPGALKLKEHMELYCQEQPFLNYLIVTSGKPHTSLHCLFHGKEYPDVRLEMWAGIEGGIVKDGQIHFPSHEYSLFLVHWAGVWHPESNTDNKDSINNKMPYRELWNYYRYFNPDVS